MVSLRKLASRLSQADLQRLARAQKLEAKRARLEAQQKEHEKAAAAAAKRREKIELKLEAIFGKTKRARKARRVKKRKYSPEALKRMAAGAKRRWAKHNAAKKAKAAAKKPGRKPAVKRALAPAPATTTA